MTDEEMLSRVLIALQTLRDTERSWGKIIIEIEKGNPQHVNVELEIKKS